MVTLVVNGGDVDVKFQPFKEEIERLLESHGIKSLHCFWKILDPVQRQHEKRARLTKIVHQGNVQKFINIVYQWDLLLVL